MLRGPACGLALTLTLFSMGCGAEDGGYIGTYAVTGQWKLDGPFAGGKSAGDLTRDLLLDKLADALPAPSFVTSKVKGFLESNVGEKIRSAVDDAMPPELRRGGTLATLLGETLATVQIDSSLVLDGEKEGDLSGSETVSELRYSVNGKSYAIKPSDLGGQITAEWAGEESRVGSLSIDRHAMKIHYGALVRHVLTTALGAAALGDLEAKVTAVFDCKSIVSAIVGSDAGLKISVVAWSHTISSSDLEGVCNAALSSAQNKALGLFELDSGVEVGGAVSWQDSASGGVELTSNGFEGTLAVLPEAIAPKVSVTFTGQRQP